MKINNLPDKPAGAATGAGKPADRLATATAPVAVITIDDAISSECVSSLVSSISLPREKLSASHCS